VANALAYYNMELIVTRKKFFWGAGRVTNNCVFKKCLGQKKNEAY